MQQQLNNNNVTSIEGLNTKVHVKVQYQNEMRRFSVTAGSYNYASLVEYVKRLFGFSVDSELHLKYKDDEDDMIIVSSDEELKSAIELFSGSKIPLRLTVELISAEKNPWKKRCNGDRHKDFKRRRSGRINGDGQNQRHLCRGKWKGAHLNFKIEKLTQKRNKLSEKLKGFGGNAPHLEAKIARIDSWIIKLKEIASVLPQENAQQPQISDCVLMRHPASFDRKCGRRGSGKWKGAHLNFKIEKLTQKRNWLSQKLKEFGGNAPHLEAKIARIDSWIIKLKEIASVLPQENPQHPQVSPTAEISGTSTDSESSSEGKKWGRRGRCGGNREKCANNPIRQRICALRKEKRQLKRLVNEGPESDLALNVERLVVIQNELAQLVQKKHSEHFQ